jgi:8-oxo-dGTP pyrophosphatase MutT (NUDIX family)
MPQSKTPTNSKPTAFSAGVVVSRREDTAWRLLVLRSYRNWDFPKGTVEAGEAPLDAAIRETAEAAQKKITRPISPALGRPEHHEWRWVNFDQAKKLLPPRLQPILAWARKQIEA